MPTTPWCDIQEFDLPATADMHVHLRNPGPMMEAVVPTIRQGGVDTVFVMPNLIPPIKTVPEALFYKRKLQERDPTVNYLMSLYLNADMTPETIIEAAKSGIAGVKSYPAGVTTNSDSGVVDYEMFYPVFEEMQKQDLVLNLHGECPSGDDIDVLNAEEKFLPTLKSIHKDFPNLRIVLEHCTTAAAIQAVKDCGPKVGATITAHHLFLTIDDVVGDSKFFCKPVAKRHSDREVLLKTIISGDSKFFFGTDSAPHPVSAKTNSNKAAAGVFTQHAATQYVLDAIDLAIQQNILNENEVTLDKLQCFLSEFGRSFYKLQSVHQKQIRLRRQVTVEITRKTTLKTEDVEVYLFREGKTNWSLEWF